MCAQLRATHGHRQPRTTTSTQVRPVAQLHTFAVLQRCRHCIPRAHPSHSSDKPSLDHVRTVQAVFVVPPVSLKMHDCGHVVVQLRRTWPACGSGSRRTPQSPIRTRVSPSPARVTRTVAVQAERAAVLRHASWPGHRNTLRVSGHTTLNNHTNSVACGVHTCSKGVRLPERQHIVVRYVAGQLL